MGDLNDPFMRNQQNSSVQSRPKTQIRSNLLQLKLMGQSHPTGLTPNLLKLFEPRPPLEFQPPPEKRKCPPYTGIAQFVSRFAEPGDPEYAPPKPEVETPAQKRERIQKLRLEKGVEKAAEDLKKYDPNNDPNASGDPYKTLFVARLNYETSESKIKREFEAYGPIKQVHLVTDQQTNKPKGYAFIEYLHTRDMKAAYKQGDGRKIDGRRVLVDVERGRTVPNWRPRRLGGGLGTSRVPGEKIAGGDDEQQQQQQPQERVSRSEEPRAREDREKSRDRGKERERDREQSRDLERERSRDRPRESHREDKHHRDRDRGRDKERESRRDRGDRDRKDRERSTRKRERDYDYEDDVGKSRERSGSKHRRGGELEEEAHGHHGYYEEEEERPERLSRYEEDEQGGGDQDHRYNNRYGDYKRSERSKSRDY
ncbi:unnamed protein product [Cochlearia groenlandica]